MYMCVFMPQGKREKCGVLLYSNQVVFSSICNSWNKCERAHI